MQEAAIRFSEGLEKRGKTLGEASVREVMRNAVPEALAGLARAALIPKP